MYLIIFEITGFICGFLKYIFLRSTHNITLLLTDLLLCQLVITAFLSGVFGFIGHYFKSDLVAESIGWPKGNPFQKEVAYTNLACGISAFGAAFTGHEYWLACIVFISVFYLGAAIEHVKELKQIKNVNPGNLFMILPDLLLPVSLIVLYLLK